MMKYSNESPTRKQLPFVHGFREDRLCSQGIIMDGSKFIHFGFNFNFYICSKSKPITGLYLLLVGVCISIIDARERQIYSLTNATYDSSSKLPGILWDHGLEPVVEAIGVLDGADSFLLQYEIFPN